MNHHKRNFVHHQKNKSVDYGRYKSQLNNYYNIRYGDNLRSIAHDQLGDANQWKQIAKINRLKNPSQLCVGKWLRLPSKIELSNSTISRSSSYNHISFLKDSGLSSARVFRYPLHRSTFIIANEIDPHTKEATYKVFSISPSREAPFHEKSINEALFDDLDNQKKPEGVTNAVQEVVVDGKKVRVEEKFLNKLKQGISRASKLDKVLVKIDIVASVYDDLITWKDRLDTGRHMCRAALDAQKKWQSTHSLWESSQPVIRQATKELAAFSAGVLTKELFELFLRTVVIGLSVEVGMIGGGISTLETGPGAIIGAITGGVMVGMFVSSKVDKLMDWIEGSDDSQQGAKAPGGFLDQICTYDTDLHILPP